MTNGIPIKRVEKNLGRPWKDVYLFEDTPNTEKYINIYKAEKSKGQDNDYNRDCKNSSNEQGNYTV